MATPGQLADTLSRSLGFKLGTVNFYGQALRDAKLLTTGGRGPSAADMSRDDAANWLIAMCCAETAKSAPAVVKLTRKAPLMASTIPRGIPSDLAFSKAHTVGELISSLMDDAQADRLGKVSIKLDFYVGGGHVKLKAAETNDKWRASMEFIHTTLEIRDKDSDESPLSPHRDMINRISRGVFEDINNTLAVPVQ